MINNSLASTRRADRQHHKASHARRKEKKWRARERSHGFIMLGMESATAGCGIPNDSLAGISHAIKIQSYRFSVRYRRRSRDALAYEEKALHLALLHTCVQIYTHPRISQRDFPVMRFVQHKSTETKMINNSFAGTLGTGRQAYHKPWQARREEKKGRKKEKKRCGFIMFVNESAAAGCDIPNDCQIN